MNTTRRLMECTELEYILLGDLRDLLEEPTTPETVRWLVAVLDALLETIPEEFVLKSDEGYLRQVLDDFPNWQSSVERLEDEYDALVRKLWTLRERVRQEEDFRSIVSELSRDLQEWMDAFRSHQSKEQRLVLLAANLEVGGED